MSLFHDASTVRARALLIGERIDVRALEQAQRLASSPLVIQAGARGVAVVFRWGAVVLFHVAPLEEVGLLDQLRRLAEDPVAKPEQEEAEVRIAAEKPEGVEASVIQVGAFTIERLQVVAEILGRSVALARSEAQVKESVAVIESWARGLEKTGTGGALERQLKRHLGATLLIQHAMAARVEIGDKPDLLWERPDLERLYARLEDEYELKERDKILDRKLALITSTVESLLNIVATKHSNRLEWYIIGLILFEIVLTVFTMVTGIGR
ncbi:MAG: RMD1 family protein [Deltaproteobacteria bacterium]|nr:RMD1 family protein [Deltaproteobacteria bacterium]